MPVYLIWWYPSDAFGSDTSRVLDIMEMRIKVMDEVFQSVYPPIDKLLPSTLGALPLASALLAA